MASAPLVATADKPPLTQGTTYRLALFTTEASISQLDIVLTGAGGEHSLSLADGSNCKWVWSSHQGPARQKNNQIDVYDLKVPDVGDISSVKLQFDIASATSKGLFGKKVDDYNFKHIEVLRVSNSRDAVFKNPNPKVMDDKNTSVTMSSPGTLPAGETSHVKLPASSSVPQSPSAAGGGAATLPASSSVLQSPSAAGGAAASAVSGSSTSFLVSVTTGGNGSDGKVAVKFHGVQGETARFELDQLKLCSDDFHNDSCGVEDEKERNKWISMRKVQKFFNDNQETYFRIETKLPDNFGDVTAVTLFHECKVTMTVSDDWEPREISVKMGEGEVETKYFAVPANTKMTTKITSLKLTSFEGISSIVTRRKLSMGEKLLGNVKQMGAKAVNIVKTTVVPAEPMRPRKNWEEKSKEYLIEVKTADTLGAGTDSDIEITLVGKTEYVAVLLEHPSNPARLEAEEPGKNFFEQSGVDRFIISVPNSQGLGDEIKKIKVRMLSGHPTWYKGVGVGKALTDGLAKGLSVITRDEWKPSYIKVIDFSKLDGRNEYFFDGSNASMKAGQAALEWNPSEPIERAPDNKQPATEEHDFLHIHNTTDPMVPKAEPKGFFGFSKKKTEDKPKEEGDKSGEEKKSGFAIKLPTLPGKSGSSESSAKDGEKGAGSTDAGAAPAEADANFGDENDEDPDSSETAPKEILKIPTQEEKKPIEKGPYRVYVQISEGRDLVGKKDNLMAEPVFQISACGQKELTRNKKKKCRSLFINQLFIFDFEQKELFDMDLAKIQISYLDGGSLFSTLLGSYEFDMSIIYHQNKHEIANVWVALLDASGESLDIKGFVKLSIAVVGETDELPVHDDDEEDEEASMDMTQCLMPPNMESKKNSLTVVCLKGESFPKLSSSKMDFFAEASFVAKRARTNKDGQNQVSPQWNEALRLPFVTPSMANDISISFKNSRRAGKNQTSGTLHVSLKDVMTLYTPDGDVLKSSKYLKPHWFNIYGTPLEIQRESSFDLGPLQSSFAKAVKQSNMGLTIGTSFCGRVLLAIEAKEDAAAFRSTKGQIEANLRKELVASSKPLMNPTYYKCRIVLHEGCQFKSDYVIVKAIFGNNSRQTDVCSKNTDTGTFDFYRNKEPQGKESCFPGDLHMQGNFTEEDGNGKGAFDPVNGLPDVIIEVWNKDKSSRLAYMRVPVAECRGTTCSPQWRDFTKCPFSPAKGNPGFLLASISVEQSSKFAGDLAVYQPSNPPARANYYLVSHVYMARSLPSADPNGLSDPYVEIYCGGSKVVTSVRPETLNPVWHENLMVQVNLPIDPHLRRPFSIQVWDQDFGGALASLFSDDFLGSVDLSWKDAFGASRFDKKDFKTYAEPTQWTQLIDPVDGSKSGEILLSFQLFNDHAEASAAGEMNIVPAFIQDCQLQITALGCRSLAPFGIRSVNDPLVEFDVASSASSVGAKGHQGKKKKIAKTSQLLKTKRANTPSGSDPNFSHTFNVNINVPLNPLFAPIVTIRCIDSWLFGLKTPMVGTGRILLESLVQPLIAASKLSPSDRFAKPKTDDKDLIDLAETNKTSFGDGREKRLHFIVDFTSYPGAGNQYWPGVKGVDPWAQWAKDQATVPLSRQIEDPKKKTDFNKIFMACFKFMNVPLPSLPHSTDRLIDAMFNYCRSLEQLHVEKGNVEIDKYNFEIDKYNSDPTKSADERKERKERLKVHDSSLYEVPESPNTESSASTTHIVWSAFAVPHPSKSQEHIVRLYHLPSMLSSFGLDSDESMLLRKCYEHRWLGPPPQWQTAELAGAGKDSSTGAIDLESLIGLFRDIMSAATQQGTSFLEQHFAIYQSLCNMTINVDVFFNFVLTRIFEEIDIDGDKRIDLKESQRLLERMGYPCNFETVKTHYANVLKKGGETLFNVDQLKLLLNSIKASAIVSASGGELARSSYGSDVSPDIVSSNARGGTSSTELKVLNPNPKNGDNEEAPLPQPAIDDKKAADTFSVAAETAKEDDEVMPYMRGRATINESLDNPKYIGQAPFSTFRLLRGQKKGGFFAKLLGGGEEFEAGILKGCVTLVAPKGSELQKAIENAPIDSAIRRIYPQVPKAPNVDPKQVVVRLYILKGFNMYCEDDANLYLRVKLGKNIIQDKGKVCKGNNQLEFYQSFELRVELPGVSQLEVSVVEKNFFGFDTVIGTTTLDLEDRYFNEKWRNGDFDNIGKDVKEKDENLAKLKRKPVEECTLRLPSNRMPQGKISCWLDIMTEKDAAKEPMFDISLVPPAPFEMRLVLWKARNMPSAETVAKDMNDLYLVASLISLNGLDIEKETDVHWRAKNGGGSFNWRMKFNFTLPQKRPRLRLSAWDQDIFGPNDAIGECQMPLTVLFKAAWKAYCAKVRPDPLAPVAKSKDGKPVKPVVSSSKGIIEYPPKPEKGAKKEDQDVKQATELNDEPAWVTLQLSDPYKGKTVDGKPAQVAFQIALMEKSIADARPVGDERKEPNRDPELPPPDRVRWSLLHPFDMLLDILGPDLFRKFKAALCVLCCLSVTFTILYFVGPLILGNVLGAAAAKR